MNTYDDVPYSSTSYAFTHPSHLAALARLFGIRPVAIDGSRVLEIGCASGGNLFPLAYSLPKSRFVGIDHSARQVRDGRSVLEQLGQTSVDLVQQDIMEFAATGDKFDFIIAHGVYSWVPVPVQDRLLTVCRDNLSDHGIAFVSYNTLPGWHFRMVVRNAFQFHVAHMSTTQAKLQGARKFLEFLAGTTTSPELRLALETEMQMLAGENDSFLFHDILETDNNPVYFHEFVSRAEIHGLQYITDAQFGNTQLVNVPPHAADIIRAAARDDIAVEQYIDFIANQKFRRSLLCRKELKLDRSLAPSHLFDLYVASSAQTSTGSPLDLRPGQPQDFKAPSGVTLTSADPGVKAAFGRLSEAWPGAVSFADLAAVAASSRLTQIPGAPAAENELAALLLECYRRGVISLRAMPDEFTTSISARPVACAYARFQAAHSGVVTSRLHETHKTDEFSRRILPLLDGTRDLDLIVSSLRRQLADETQAPSFPGLPIREREATDEYLTRVVTDRITRFAKAAVLVA